MDSFNINCDQLWEIKDWTESSTSIPDHAPDLITVHTEPMYAVRFFFNTSPSFLRSHLYSIRFREMMPLKDERKSG
jgi:hypothetical protein